MRMWMIPPKYLCKQHLLGEHKEIHMLAGCLKKNKNIQGFLDNKLVFPLYLNDRHEQLAEELTERGYKHKTELQTNPYTQDFIEKYGRYIPNNETITYNTADLTNRCQHCKKRILGDKP